MSLKHMQEHAKELLKVLDNLLSIEDKDSILVNIVDCAYHYVIHLIPSNFQHPLKDIVNSVKNPFFLVSKLPDTPTHSGDDSTDDEEGELPKSLPEIAVITKQHVFVGTPISHQVSHLFWQRNFHNSEVEITEKYLDTSSLQKLELRDARYLASIYVQCVKQQKDLPEMWLLCDHGSPQGVDYMGVVPVITEDQKQPQQISTVMIRREDYDEKKAGSSLSNKKKQHMNFHRANQSETHGYARYNVYGTLDGYDEESDEPQSGISIEFAWDGVREILQPPPSSSNAVLNIFAHPEDVQAILPGITNELNMLGELFGKFQNKFQEESAGEIEQNGSDEEFDQPELKKTILEFLDKLRLQSMGQSKKVDPSVSSPSAAISFDTAEHLKRQDLDNTESLWVFLKELPSTGQMIFCLDVIIQQLFLGEYQPVLYANNQTQIAILMKEVISCSTDKERAEVNRKIKNVLTPAAAIQSIVDIGIHKLQNDYINFFVKQELVTKDLLEYFVTKGASSSEKLQKLLKLHCILSLVTLATSYARINYDDLRQLVPATLKFYENHSHTEIPVFSLSLPAFSTSSSKVKNTCVRQFQPQTWVAAITTTNQYITMMQLDAKEPSESFVEESNTLRASSYSITTASTHKVCIPKDAN
jgi:protein zwilch